MNNTIKQLKTLAAKSEGRALKNINNLIGRLEYFESIGDDEKLECCIAEAQLWLLG